MKNHLSHWKHGAEWLEKVKDPENSKTGRDLRTKMNANRLRNDTKKEKREKGDQNTHRWNILSIDQCRWEIVKEKIVGKGWRSKRMCKNSWKSKKKEKKGGGVPKEWKRKAKGERSWKGPPRWWGVGPKIQENLTVFEQNSWKYRKETQNFNKYHLKIQVRRHIQVTTNVHRKIDVKKNEHPTFRQYEEMRGAQSDRSRARSEEATILRPEVENLSKTPRKGLNLRGRGVLDVHPYIQLTFVPRRGDQGRGKVG